MPALRDSVASVPEEVGSWPRRFVAWLRKPSSQTDLLQIVKSVVAAVVAWLLAVHVFDMPQPFIPPWVALLTVHATVYRSFSHGTQAVAATVLGVGLSWATVELFGFGWLGLSVALLTGMLLSRAGLLRREGVMVATTALFVLTTGYAHQESPVLLYRVVDALLGVAVGVVVNLVIIPPLNDRSAEMQIDRINLEIGRLLRDMAREMDSEVTPEHSGDWVERTRRIDGRVERAWALVHQARESGWWNPRRYLTRKTADPTAYEHVLLRIEAAVAEVRSMARTVHESTRSAQQWDDRFRDPWLHLVSETGWRVADRHADVGPLHEDVDELSRELSGQDLPDLLWPLYGALLTNLLNVIDILDDVATSRPVRP